ncbi:hypothetical protein IAU60_003821 [Kwoniella sp. DSM 27419]
MNRFFLLLTVLAVCLALVQAKPLARPLVKREAQPVEKVTRNERLSNAERIARGLPVRTPKRLYDATKTHPLEARASRRSTPELTNAERIARGLPLNAPETLYNPTAPRALQPRASGQRRK